MLAILLALSPRWAEAESELGRHFADGPATAAREAFARRDHREARRLLSLAGEGTPVRYLRALSALRGADPRVASRAFDALALDYPALTDRALTNAGLALEELGEHGQAAERFARVPPGSLRFPDARLGLARAKRRSGDGRGAFDALEPLSELPPPPAGRDFGAEALIARADLARALSDEQAERDALLALWASHPLSPLATIAGRRLGACVPVEARVRRAQALLRAHRNVAAIEALGPLLPSLALPEPLACRAHLAYGRALRKERRHPEAIRVLEPVVERCRPASVEALMVLASSKSIATPEAGPGLYDRVAAEFPSHPEADAALYFAADLELQAGRLEGVRSRLERLIARYPQGAYAGDAHFRLFWLRRAAGEHRLALAELDRLISRARGLPSAARELQRAEYWRARTLEALGRGEEAKRRLVKLAEAEPATYYGVMARRRLSASASPAPTAWAEEGPAEGAMELLLQAPHAAQGVELLRLGFPEAAARELRAVDRSGLELGALRELSRLLAAAGDVSTAHLVARVHFQGELERGPAGAPRGLLELGFPRAYREPIERRCEEVGVDPDFLQALIREESAYDPRAYSWAGAVGLTQLLPSVATEAGRPLGLGAVSAEDLLDPELSIRLGCAKLGQLLRDFSGSEAHAFAAYNADPERVRAWLAKSPGAELDEWIEQIPIAETRGYVKKLLRSVEAYRLVYRRP